MKKLILMFVGLLILLGCKKSSFEAKFDDTPNVRIGKAIAEVKNILSTAPNGWVATTPTGDGGGYGFYMSFDATENVTMYSDMNDVTSVNSIASYYRIKQDAGVDLVFDTYCYLTWLNDPTPSTFGGNLKTGFKSDVDFIYQRSTADSVIFLGKRYRQQLTLVKATAAQKASYVAGELKTAMDKFKAFFSTRKNAYIEITAGTKTGVSPDFTNSVANGKRIELSTLLPDNSVSSAKGKIATSLDAVTILDGGLTYQGIVFVKMAWKDATTLALYDNKGKEYIINNNPVPLTEFKTVFKYNGAFNGIMITGRTLPPGVVSGWNTLWASQISSYDLNNATMESMQFRLINATTAKLEVWFVIGGSRYLADASYTYVINNDIITLSNYIPAASNANWNNGWVVTAVKNYFINASFKMDWVVSSDPTVSALGGLYKVGDATNFYYGRAIKN